MRSYALGATLLGLLLLVSCRPQEASAPQETRLLALLTAQTGKSYDLAQAQYLTRLAQAREDCEVKIWNAESNATKQEQQIQEAMQAKPFALLLIPVAGSNHSAAISQAMQAGVFVLTLGNQAAGLPTHSHLSVDQRAMGRIAGQHVVESLQRKQGPGKAAKGRVVILKGNSEPESSQRMEGLSQALKPHPEILIVHEVSTAWSVEGGLSAAQEALRLQPQLDVVIGFNDLIARGASNAAKSRRDDILILGMDGFRGPLGGLTMILQGEIDATVYHPPLVDLAFALIDERLKNPAFQPQPSYQPAPEIITPAKAEILRVKGLPKPPAP